MHGNASHSVFISIKASFKKTGAFCVLIKLKGNHDKKTFLSGRRI